MIEKIGKEEVVVHNYTSNFDVKEYMQEELIPKAFPNIPVNKLNLGFTGIVSELLGQIVEDGYGTAAFMTNEAFITKAVLPRSIYAEAATYNIGYSYAVPSRCSFGLELWLPDIKKYATRVEGSAIYRYILDKNTKLALNENSYILDYDVYIDFQDVSGETIYNVYYNMEETNSISEITNPYIKHQVTSINWLILFLDLKEYSRTTEIHPITDNMITTNSDVELSWSQQIAGIDLIYITPQGERLPMKLKPQYSSASVDPFVWYKFDSDDQMRLLFSSNTGYFQPAFNSSVESTIYTCNGKSSDFPSYDRKSGVPVEKVGDRYDYNANTRMVGLCYSASTGGLDKGDIEDLRNEVILAKNTCNVLTTTNDIKLWFQTYGRRHGTKAEFFLRRDDPSGRLYAQFIAITNGSYIYPTNTLTLDIQESQCDYVNQVDGIAEEFIIQPGHLWEYADTDDETIRDTVYMVKGIDGKYARISDDALPPITSERPFMFVNPFYIKIHRDPCMSVNYNCLLNHTSWPEDVHIQTNCFYQFQLATFSIQRGLSKATAHKYKLEVICVPVVTTDSDLKYIEGIGSEYPVEQNCLRLVLILRNRMDGEAGYIEMIPSEFRPGEAIAFQTELVVHDNLDSNLMLELDLEKTKGLHSLVQSGPRAGKVYLDSSETSFHFATMMKDFTNLSNTNLFGDESYRGYLMTNRFANAYRDLTLFQPMSMMRSVIEFHGKNGSYHIQASLTPMLKYDVPLDETKMSYFIQAFYDQYHAMQPMLSKLEHANLDFKFYNTYGRSNNYYIGPKEGETILTNSDLLLDNVYVKIKFIMAVYDRSMWSQTCEAVIHEIVVFFETFTNQTRTDIHASDLIHIIIDNQPNVRYLRFLGFNDYDAKIDSIFTKYTDISELREDQLQPHVPEMIRVDPYSIEITEEIG